MGYLKIDNRTAGGNLQEYDTVSCKHCQAVLRIYKKQREGYWCNTCFGPICETCAATRRCDPFMKKIERKLASERFLKTICIGE